MYSDNANMYSSDDEESFDVEPFKPNQYRNVEKKIGQETHIYETNLKLEKNF